MCFDIHVAVKMKLHIRNNITFFLYAIKPFTVLFVAYILMYLLNYYRLVLSFPMCLYYISAKIKIINKRRIFYSMQLNIMYMDV